MKSQSRKEGRSYVDKASPSLLLGLGLPLTSSGQAQTPHSKLQPSNQNLQSDLRNAHQQSHVILQFQNTQQQQEDRMTWAIPTAWARTIFFYCQESTDRDLGGSWLSLLENLPPQHATKALEQHMVYPFDPSNNNIHTVISLKWEVDAYTQSCFFFVKEVLVVRTLSLWLSGILASCFSWPSICLRIANTWLFIVPFMLKTAKATKYRIDPFDCRFQSCVGFSGDFKLILWWKR